MLELCLLMTEYYDGGLRFFMSLDLDISPEDRDKLRANFESSSTYKQMQEKMRAAVLLCTQELMNGSKKSRFEQFHRELPPENDIELALAIAADYLKTKGLTNTLSVLTDEIEEQALQEGQKQLEELFQDGSDDMPLAQLLKVAVE